MLYVNKKAIPSPFSFPFEVGRFVAFSWWRSPNLFAVGCDYAFWPAVVFSEVAFVRWTEVPSPLSARPGGTSQSTNVPSRRVGPPHNRFACVGFFPLLIWLLWLVPSPPRLNAVRLNSRSNRLLGIFFSAPDSPRCHFYIWFAVFISFGAGVPP